MIGINNNNDHRAKGLDRIMPELVTISNKGQMTIPQRFREELLFRSGDKIYCDVIDGRLVCEKPADFFSLKGCIKNKTMPDNEEVLFTNAVADHVMEKE